jgi:chromosome segregation ATPase
MKEGNNLKDESSHLIKLREKDKQALIEAEDRLREMNNQLSAAMHSNRIIQKEHQNISDELAGKLEELRRANMAKSSYEQELAELRPLKLKYQQLAEESSNLKNSALNKESAQTRLQRQIDSLEDALRAKDISLSEQNKSIEKYKEEILRLEGELDNIQDHAALLNSNVKQTEYLQSEASSLKQQVNEYRDKERDQIRTIEQLKSELKKAAEAVKDF